MRPGRAQVFGLTGRGRVVYSGPIGRTVLQPVRPARGRVARLPTGRVRAHPIPGVPLMTVKCSNAACGKVFGFAPPGGAGSRHYSGDAKDKGPRSFAARCPHCGKSTTVTVRG